MVKGRFIIGVAPGTCIRTEKDHTCEVADRSCLWQALKMSEAVVSYHVYKDVLVLQESVGIDKS